MKIVLIVLTMVVLVAIGVLGGGYLTFCTGHPHGMC